MGKGMGGVLRITDCTFGLACNVIASWLASHYRLEHRLHMFAYFSVLFTLYSPDLDVYAEAMI